MAYFGSYTSQGVGRALQNFRHRMSKAFNWSQPYQPSADMMDSENRRRWFQAAKAAKAPERYNKVQPTAAQRAARETSPVRTALGQGQVEQLGEGYIKKRKKASRIVDLFNS